MIILGECYDEAYGLEEYDLYDPFEGEDNMDIYEFIYRTFEDDRWGTIRDAIDSIALWCKDQDIYVYNFLIDEHLYRADFVTLDDGGEKVYGSIFIAMDDDRRFFVERVSSL